MNTENTTNGNSKDGDNYNMKNNKKETLNWILKYNRTPYPYSPLNAAKKDCEPKQPGYFDGNYFKQLKWKNYQDWGQLTEDVKQELIKLWHGNQRIEGIGCNAGWNGEFYFSMIDFDLKNFESLEAMEQAISGWENRNPELLMVPRSRTQSGGCRYYIGFESVSKNWGNTIQFTLTQGGEKSLGELMTGPGGLGIILGKGLKGDYSWDRNACGEIPVFPNPESIGLYQVEKAIAISTPITSIYDTSDTPELAREALSYIPVYEDYQTWIDIGMACHAAKLDFEDWDNWSQGGKNYTNSNDAFNHWKSFKDKPGGIQAGTLFHYAKAHGWNPPRRNYDYQNSLRNSSNSQSNVSGTAALKPDIQSNVLPFQRQEPPKLPPIIEPITALINKNLQGSELEDEIQLIAEQYKRQPNNVWKIYYKRLEELEREDNKESQKESLEKLLRLDKKTLDLSNYLHPILATPLKNVAKWMGTSQEAILTTLLPVASSLIHLDTRLELLKPPVKFYANPIIWSGIVAESGSLKSPTQKLIIDPLYKMQSEIDSQYDLEFADYQEELSYYKKSKNDKNAEYTPEPKAPKRREYFTVDCTSEAMATIQSDQPERGFLGFQDELKALISSQNAYRGGKGSDTEKLLSGRDGSGIKVNRAGGKRLFCERSGFSITGGIQPDVLKQLMGDFSDPNGFWARFIWCNLPVAPSRYPEDFTSFDIDQLLTGIYKNLEAQPPQLHKLSPEAQEIYKDWYNQLDDLKLNEEIKQALRAVYSKFKRVTGEFALVLHRVNAATAGEMPEEFISKGTMEKAIRLAKFYISQVKLIHAEGAAEQGDIPSLLQKVLKLAEAKQRNKQQPLTASDVSNGIKALRGKGRAEEIRSIFMQLAEMGKGTIEGSGIRLKFRYSEIDPKIDQPKKPVSTTGKGIESLDNKKIDQVAQKIDQNRPKIDPKIDLLQESAFPMGKGVESLDDKKIDQIDRNSRPETIDQVGQLADPWTHHDGLEKNESIEAGSIRSIFSEGNPQNNCIEEDSGTNERSIFGSIFEGERSISEDERSIFSGNGDRSPEPQPEPIPPSEPKTLDFNLLNEGDILFDNLGQPHKLIKPVRGMWQSHRKDVYISRNDVTQGKYHRATVEDITKLIERTIKGKNKVQAQWLCDVYGGDTDSLMALAIDTNPEELALIFDFDDW